MILLYIHLLTVLFCFAYVQEEWGQKRLSKDEYIINTLFSLTGVIFIYYNLSKK